MPDTQVKNGLYWSDKTGTWHYAARVGGRRAFGDTGHSKKAFAATFLAEMKVAAARDKGGLAPRVKCPTLDQALEMWERAEAGSFTARHIKDRLDTLRRHCEAVLNLPLNKLDTARLDALRAEYLAGERRTPNWKPGTVLARSPGGWNKVRRHLMAVMNWCIARELLDSMPFRSKPIKSQEKVFAVIWPEKAGEFLGVVDGITRSQDKRTAIRLMVQLGLREDEALNALWEGFDKRMGVYRVFKSKNREAREIALPPGLIDYLREAHGDGKRGLIMTDMEDGAHRRSYTKRTVGQAGALMGVEGLHPHALRATFATAHWEAGTPLSQITAMLGHKDPKTTMIYIRQRPRDAAAAQKKVAKTMGL